MKILKKISLVAMLISYLLAGLNHFRKPASYIAIIPHWLPAHMMLNILSGSLEIIFALLLISPKTRRWGAYGIILLLIAFIPVHTKMVGNAPFLLGDTLIVTPLIAWIRLIIFQPLLILWAWWHKE